MLVRFADAFNHIRNSKLLSEQSVRTMLTRPLGALGLDHGRPGQTYRGCGWDVRPVDQRQGTPLCGYAGGCASRTKSGDARAGFVHAPHLYGHFGLARLTEPGHDVV